MKIIMETSGEDRPVKTEYQVLSSNFNLNIQRLHASLRTVLSVLPIVPGCVFIVHSSEKQTDGNQEILQTELHRNGLSDALFHGWKAQQGG